MINLYTSNDYIYVNNYLRKGKLDKNSKYTENEIKSFAYCLHKALTSRISNVKNGSIFYRGVSRKFPSNLGIGSKFIFSEFISVSEDINIAKSFAGRGTLFYIRIENNGKPKPNYYCYNIYQVSQYKSEREILITSNCTFHITKISINNGYADEIYLTCEGFKNI